jgi:hypothetical protein
VSITHNPASPHHHHAGSHEPAEAVQRRRVSDRVIDAFEYACLMHDAEVAEQLLAIVDFLADRKARRFGGDRRHAIGIDLEAARARLQALMVDAV